MNKNLLIVAALLLINLAGIAAAADLPEHQSKHARNLLATLNLIGINSHEVQNLVADADTRIEKNYFYLNEQEAIGGKWALRYRLGSEDASVIPTSGSRRMELHYAPKDSHFEFKARTDGVTIGYHLKLE